MCWCWWPEIDWWSSWWSLETPFSLLPPLLWPPKLKGLLSIPQSAAFSLGTIITPLTPAVFKIMSCNPEWLSSSKQALIIAYQVISRKNAGEKKNQTKTKHLKKFRCGDHIGETVMSLRLTMLFLKMSMTNSAHAFSHSLINSWQLFPGIMQENLDKAGGLITNNISELYQWIADFSLQHLPWNSLFSQNLLKYGTGIYQYITFKKLASIHCCLHKASSKSCVLRGGPSAEKLQEERQNTTEINWEISEDQKKYVDNLWVIAEKPL